MSTLVNLGCRWPKENPASWTVYFGQNLYTWRTHIRTLYVKCLSQYFQTPFFFQAETHATVFFYIPKNPSLCKHSQVRKRYSGKPVPTTQRLCKNTKQTINKCDLEYELTETNRQSVAHVDYSIVAKCQTKIAAIFSRILGIFRCTLKILFIYLCFLAEPLTMICGTQGFLGTLVWKHRSVKKYVVTINVWQLVLVDRRHRHVYSCFI
jgi:hypothetical protein